MKKHIQLTQPRVNLSASAARVYRSLHNDDPLQALVESLWVSFGRNILTIMEWPHA